MCSIVSVFLLPTHFGNLRSFCDQERAIKFPLCYVSWIHTEESQILQIAKISENLVTPGTCALFSAPYLLAIDSPCFIKRKSFSIKILLVEI